jgi:hypothetical protein
MVEALDQPDTNTNHNRRNTMTTKNKHADLNLVFEAAEQHNGWTITQLYTQQRNYLEDMQELMGIVSFKRADLPIERKEKEYGTAQFVLERDSNSDSGYYVGFYWGHYDLTKVESVIDFRDRVYDLLR